MSSGFFPQARLANEAGRTRFDIGALLGLGHIVILVRMYSPEAERENWRDEDGREVKERDAELVKELAAPLYDLPKVEYAFAYGSGVFAQPDLQPDPTEEVPMVDYILGVSSPADWHSQNIEQNPHHYASWLARFGGKMVSSVAENVGVGVHFNAFVPWQNKTIKYGVIGVDKLLQDVLTWQKIYISGRLQKPVRTLVDQVGLEDLNRTNLQAALSAALLLLPSKFTEEDLYATICGLSYMGDVRMLFAEDKNKVRKIVQGSATRFHELYKGSIYNCAAVDILQPPSVFSSDLQSKIIQNESLPTTSLLLSSLPSSILHRLAYQTGIKFDSSYEGCNAVAEAVTHSREGHANMVRKAVSHIVRASSFRQMVSGFLAAGGINATHYVARKVSKAWRSRQ